MKQLGLDFELTLTPAPRRRSYHVRSHQTAAEVEGGEARARRQEDWILRWFHARPGESVTPSELARRFEVCRNWPITSVRRALTNLTNRGLLQHHAADRRTGPYGANESTWSLAREPVREVQSP